MNFKKIAKNTAKVATVAAGLYGGKLVYDEYKARKARTQLLKSASDYSCLKTEELFSESKEQVNDELNSRDED